MTLFIISYFFYTDNSLTFFSYNTYMLCELFLFLIIIFCFISASNGNRVAASVSSPTNNNLEMKRQSSLQLQSSTSPIAGRERAGSETDAAMTSLSGSYPTTTNSTPVHAANVPASPFRLLREESVDGTLSPVSLKGGMDTLDNDTSGRRKVTLNILSILLLPIQLHKLLFLCCSQALIFR